MSKCVFYTKYNLPKHLLREFDSHSDVDRLSYVDNTVLINRFMQAGQNLNLAYQREKAFYHSVEDIENGVGIPTPVYKTDPVIADKLNDALREQAEKVLADGKSAGIGVAAMPEDSSESRTSEHDDSGKKTD